MDYRNLHRVNLNIRLRLANREDFMWRSSLKDEHLKVGMAYWELIDDYYQVAYVPNFLNNGEQKAWGKEMKQKFAEEKIYVVDYDHYRIGNGNHQNATAVVEAS